MTKASTEEAIDHAKDTSEATKNSSSLTCEECLKENIFDDHGPRWLFSIGLSVT